MRGRINPTNSGNMHCRRKKGRLKYAGSLHAVNQRGGHQASVSGPLAYLRCARRRTSQSPVICTACTMAISSTIVPNMTSLLKR